MPTVAASRPFRSKAPQNQNIIAHFDGVDKNYGSVRALADFNFEVRAGELVSLLGPNGAGKTTAIRLLLGLAKPSAGHLSVFGGDPASTDTHIRVGAMLQVGRVPETLRVGEHVDLFSSYYSIHCQSPRLWRLPASSHCATASLGCSQAGRNNGCYSRLQFAGIPISCFSTNPR